MKYLGLAVIGLAVLLLVTFLLPDGRTLNPQVADQFCSENNVNKSVSPVIEVLAYHRKETEKIRVSSLSFSNSAGVVFRCARRIGIEAPVNKTGEDILAFLKVSLPGYQWEIISPDYFRGVLE